MSERFNELLADLMEEYEGLRHENKQLRQIATLKAYEDRGMSVSVLPQESGTLRGPMMYGRRKPQRLQGDSDPQEFDPEILQSLSNPAMSFEVARQEDASPAKDNIHCCTCPLDNAISSGDLAASAFENIQAKRSAALTEAHDELSSGHIGQSLSAEKRGLMAELNSRANRLDAAMSSAKESASAAFKQKKMTMSTAFQARIQNQRLDERSLGHGSTRLDESKQRSRRIMCRIAFERITFIPAFDLLFGLLIVLNSLAIGAEIEYNARHTTPSILFQMLSFFFATVFATEFVIRFAANHMSVYFFGPDRMWNWFDLLMVIVSWLEVANLPDDAGQGHGSMLRLVKMVRLLRIARVMRFVPQLRVIIFMIFESLKSLVWLLIVLITILYVFAIVFTMASTEYSRESGSQNADAAGQSLNSPISKHYGTLLRSLYSCLKAITSGQSWGELLDPLLEVGAFYVIVFLLYIVFSLFALFNIITGVFVDGALEKSENDRDLVVQKELAYKKACVENLKALFIETDENKSGAMSVHELEVHMQDPRFESYLSHLNIDTSDVNELFAHLDQDGNGYITMDEFIMSMMHLLRGQTAEQSVRRLMKENRALKAHLVGFMQFVRLEISSIKDHVMAWDGFTC